MKFLFYLVIICDNFTYSIAMLFILLPVSRIGGSIQMQILSLAVSLIFFPSSNKNITIRMNQSPLSFSHIISPIPLKNRPIRPILNSSSVFKTSFPLSDINSCGFKNIRSESGKKLIFFFILIVDEFFLFCFTLFYEVIAVLGDFTYWLG
jgi:hypothetical protein